MTDPVREMVAPFMRFPPTTKAERRIEELVEQVVEFVVPLPPVALRRNNGKGRFVTADRAQYSREVIAAMYEQGVKQRGGPDHMRGALHAEVTWRQIGHGDTDNCLAGVKVLFDCLGCAPKRPARDMIYCGVYEDDGQIEQITVRRERVATKAAEGVYVRIERL